MRKLRLFLFKWHRRLGVMACLLFIHLSISGIFLNHTQELSLHDRFISSDWLLQLYALETSEPQLYQLNNQPLVIHKNSVFIQGNQSIACAQFVGVAQHTPGGDVFIGCQTQLYWFSPEWQLIEKVDLSALAAERIGYCDELLCVADTENQFYQFNENVSEFSPIDCTSVVSCELQQLTPMDVDEVSVRMQQIIDQLPLTSNIISYEKLMQDIHSGRLFGMAGVYFMDVIAVILILISVSGVYLWGSQLMRKKQTKRTHHN